MNKGSDAELSEELLVALKAAIRFNSPDVRPGHRRVGFVLPVEIAWPDNGSACDILDLLIRALTKVEDTE